VGHVFDVVPSKPSDNELVFWSSHRYAEGASVFSRCGKSVVTKARLVECGFYIPIHRDKHLSDGQAHLQEAWEWLDDSLYDFGGGTRSGTLHIGFYRDPDTDERVHDQSCRFEIALPRKQVGALRLLLRDACRVFQQKCIYLSVAGYVEFVKGARDERG
jgi:hypothetical protein